MMTKNARFKAFCGKQRKESRGGGRERDYDKMWSSISHWGRWNRIRAAQM